MELKIILFAVICGLVTADIYMHVPRGSNNRQNEDTRPRRNANRLFDSQNNNRGGYNVGEEPMEFYEGSIIPIEWTNQHGCGIDNLNCNIVIQYMCGEHLRNGNPQNTETIRENRNQCGGNCNENERYGMHEDYYWYHECRYTSRNKGLYTADQDLEGDSAKYTRQNPGGTRRGYECPEERDYWPYWRPTPWIDIAVITADKQRCTTLRKESQNIKGKYRCQPSDEFIVDYHEKNKNNNNNDHTVLPVNKEECEERGFTWVEVEPWKDILKYEVKAPACVTRLDSVASRDNHNGNGPTGQPNTYKWTVPKGLNDDSCAIRIRYNISTGDYPQDTHDHTYNNEDTRTPLAESVGLDSEEEAKKRGYVMEGNPTVYPFNLDDGIDYEKFPIQLAINTAQYGRTFEDRSHLTKFLKKTDSEEDCDKIHNVVVRGKRGNIVQVYPAVEYDFVPNRVNAKEGECVHFQWTGSDNNPGNNAGQGQAKTDRSNVIMSEDKDFSDYRKNRQYTRNHNTNKMHGWLTTNYPKQIEESFLGLSEDDKTSLAFNGDPGNGPLLNNASPYYNLGVRKLNEAGTWNYFCTRNNAFTNRSQKGTIVVKGRKKNASDQEEEEDEKITTLEKVKEELEEVEDMFNDMIQGKDSVSFSGVKK